MCNDNIGEEASNLDSLVYFWEEKGDVERFTGWRDMQPMLQQKYPEILKAWSDYKAARTILGDVLKAASVRADGRRIDAW
jgi:hypothetical protein